MSGRIDDLIADVRYIKERIDSLHDTVHVDNKDIAERVVKLETDGKWARGGIRISITGIISIITALAVKFFLK